MVACALTSPPVPTGEPPLLGAPGRSGAPELSASAVDSQLLAPGSPRGAEPHVAEAAPNVIRSAASCVKMPLRPLDLGRNFRNEDGINCSIFTTALFLKRKEMSTEDVNGEQPGNSINT